MSMNVFHESLAGRFILRATGAIGVVPIPQGIIKADTQAFGAHRLNIFSYQVATWTLLRSAIVGSLGVEVAEAFVMLGGHHHIFLSGLLGQLGPCARSIGLGLELLRQGRI